MAMNCETFRQNIDAWIDGELNKEIKEEMDRHAQVCAPCARLMEEASLLSAVCADMNEGLSVPLPAQAAWRRAVRAEAKKTRRPSGAWLRGIGSMAAALVVLVAGTLGMRMGGEDSLPVQTIMMAENSGYSEYDLYSNDLQRPDAAGGVMRVGYGLQSDGSVDVSRAAGTQDKQEPAAAQTVVLRSAARSINSDAYDADIQWLEDLVSEYGAYFEERSETAAPGDGVTGRIAHAIVRVPSDRLDDFLMELDQLGQTVLRSESAEDVTGRFMDTQSRLDALYRQKDKLDEMMEAAANVEELIAIDDKLTDVMSSIETLEGDILRWESRQSFSRVTLTLTELLARPVATDAPLGMRMQQGFDESVSWLNSFGQDALVTLATAAPRLVIWIPALALVIVLLCAAFRKRR